jgi:hypothetical protein
MTITSFLGSSENPFCPPLLKGGEGGVLSAKAAEEENRVKKIRNIALINIDLLFIAKNFTKGAVTFILRILVKL